MAASSAAPAAPAQLPPPPPARADVVTRQQLPRFNSRRLSSILSEEAEEPSAPMRPPVPPSSDHHDQIATEPSAESLLARGVHAMDETLAQALEAALGAPIPSVAVRFEGLTIRATIALSAPPRSLETLQVPSLLSPVKKQLSRLLAREQVVHKDILRDVTGAFRPGRLTLVLGHPGSGKSSLMKYLSGRFPVAKNLEIQGQVRYNGAERQVLLGRLPRYVSYADQRDDHYGRLTVLETLAFAHRCCSGQELPEWMVQALASCGPEHHERALAALSAHHRHAPELMLKKLGLEGVRDKFVGDRLQPGVNPSEKKRVTVGEIAFGMTAVHLFDEISEGLDVPTTIDLIESLRSVAVNYNRTVVVSLTQPAPEVVELFDDILVMHEGSVMYHGPRMQVLSYFSGLGFDCPPRKDIADFLLELGSEKQHQYRNPATELVPFTASEFAACFKQSTIYQEMLAFVQTDYERPEGGFFPQNEDILPFRQTFLQELAFLLRRQFLLAARNKALVIGRTFMVLLMGILYGTTFWQLPDNNSQLVLGLLFSCSMFLSLGQAAQLGVFMNNRSVFYKQRGGNFYRTSSYVLASCISQVPFALLEAILFGSFLYWMGGYVALVDRFAVFLVTLFLCQMCFTAFFFFLASASPTLMVAQPLMVISILLFVLFGGFLVTKNNIPSYFMWLYWMNPIAWCIRALSVNQYTSPRYQTCEYKGVDYCKLYRVKTNTQYSLATFDLDDNTMWIYYAWMVFVAAYLVLSGLSYVWLEYKRYETPENTMALSADIKSVRKELKRQQTLEANESSAMTEAMDVHILPTSSTRDAKPPTGDGTNYRALITPSGRDQSTNKTAELAITIPRDGRCGFVPVTLAFQDLWYSVPLPGSQDDDNEIDLLRDISGFALPGTMTAFMGPAGAGKTTLMDVLAGRKTNGRIRGDIFLNGYPATDLAIRRCLGYGAHVDVHSDASTIREAMMFSALLRQDSSIPRIDKLVAVEVCIDLLELRPIANRIIRGSTKEQLKRLSIGVELASSPSLLFMDEPTKGLDPRSAMIIMTALRKVADTGRTVVCTMHQPSSDALSLFDSALILQRGGQMVFFGETGKESTKLIDYFESIPGVLPLKAGHNPATWVLDNIDSRTQTTRRMLHRRRSTINELIGSVDFATVFETSDQCRILEEDLDQDGLTRPSAFLPEITFERKRAGHPLTQFVMLSKRFLRVHWRTPTYNLTRLVMSIILALLFGIVYKDTQFATFRGANAGVGMIFLSSVFFGMIAYNAVLPIAAAERAAFYRERGSETYNALWYFVASTITEIPYVFLSSLLFTSILFPLVGFQGTHAFLMYWFVTSLHVLVQVYMGQFMVAVLPSPEAAVALGALLNSVFLLFAGFNPPTSKIPHSYKWIHTISPPSYTISALTALVFTECPAPGADYMGCRPLKNAPQRLAGASLKVYVEKIFMMKHDDIWSNVAVLYGLIVGFRALTLLGLRYVNYNRKK